MNKPYTISPYAVLNLSANHFNGSFLSLQLTDLMLQLYLIMHIKECNDLFSVFDLFLFWESFEPSSAFSPFQVLLSVFITIYKCTELKKLNHRKGQ